MRKGGDSVGIGLMDSDVRPATMVGVPNDVMGDALTLSPAERQQIQNLAERIDLYDYGTLVRYGGKLQQELGTFVDCVLRSASSDEPSDVSELLGKMCAAIEEFTKKTEFKFFNAFRSPKAKLQVINSQYLKALDVLDDVMRRLTGHHMSLQVALQGLNETYERNLECYKGLTVYIAAGKQKLADVEQNEMEVLRRKAQQPGNRIDALDYADLQNCCESFAQQINDLELTREVCLQTAFQIQMLRSSTNSMVCRISSNISNTIPLWKQKMAEVFVASSNEMFAEAQKTVDAVSAQKIDVEAILSGNQDFLKAIRETQQIYAEDCQIRAAAKSWLHEMEAKAQ